MGNKILVDTNILIDYSKGKDKHLKKLLEEQKDNQLILYVNPIIVAEYFTDQTLIDKNKLEMALAFISLFSSLPIGKKEGLLAGQLLRANKTDYIADALIAACCLVHNLKLATRNTKHFTKIPNLEFYKLTPSQVRS